MYPAGLHAYYSVLAFLCHSTLCMREVKALVRLRLYAGSSEPSQLANAMSTEISSPGPIVLQIWFLFVWFDCFRPINNLTGMSGQSFLGLISTKLGLMCLAQGHNALTPVRLEAAALLSGVKHSTTEPLHSHAKYGKWITKKFNFFFISWSFMYWEK